MTTAAQPQKRPRGAARRELLLEAVLTIVADVGAEAVTHRRVAEVAQLPLASTTYWFASKDELLTAALELAAERDVARLQELAQDLCDVHPVSGSAALDAAVNAVVDPLDEPTSRASLMAAYALLLEAARRPSLQELAARWTDAYLETVGALLARAGLAAIPAATPACCWPPPTVCCWSSLPPAMTRTCARCCTG